MNSASRFIVLLLLIVPLKLIAADDIQTTFGVFDGDSKLTIDHSAWDGLLKIYLVETQGEVARFRYGEVVQAHKHALNTYLESLQSTQVTQLSRPEQMAFWINLYNALTIKVVLDAYPVDSIKDIKGGLLSFGPWGKKRVNVQGLELSLDDIEHEILRPVFGDSRVHYAVNCASIGCPNLQADAFTAENTEALLNKGAREYVNHERGINIDGGKLTASSIYKWFKEDFGGDDTDVLAHLKQYANAESLAALANVKKIHAYTYDWSLNE